MSWIVERMISLNDPNPQPKSVKATSFEDADRIAREHTLSEPWRCHAYVIEQGTAEIFHRDWYHRDMTVNNPRPLLIDRDF